MDALPTHSDERERRFDALAAKAAQVFGVHELRPGQRELMAAVLDGKDALGLLPTGGGKSLCFQLPSLVLPGPVVVVTPLLSLAEDQTDQLDLLYVTPERLQNPAFMARLRAAGCSLLVVDEAHCIAERGHDFRPAYLHLRAAAEALGRPPILALTATATATVALNIITTLGLRDPVIVRRPSVRTNLHLSVRHCETKNEKEEQLIKLLRAERGSALVYTSTIRAAKAVWTLLVQLGFAAGIYHGELSATVRDATQDAFTDGRYRIVVATKAFGMGIDKPDTRLVVHYQVPGSIESYYQEVGRAGRDGNPARGVLLYWQNDVRVQQFFLTGKHPRKSEVQAFVDGTGRLSARERQVLEADAERVGLDAEALWEVYKQRWKDDKRRLKAMLRFAELRECRTASVARYFGDAVGTGCGRCDVCER